VSEILGFLIAFGLLAAFISTLTSGALRNIAFGLLIVFAIIIGQERLGTQLSALNFPFSSAIAPANTRGGAAVQSAPQSTGMGGPVYNTIPPTYNDNYPSRNTARSSFSGTEANRRYDPNAPYYGGYYNDPYVNDPYYSGSYPGGYYPPDSGYGQRTLTGRGVRALW
jgi:hypothetical protein